MSAAPYAESIGDGSLPFPAVKSFESALPLESTMLGLRQPPKSPRGAFDGKVKTHVGPNEVHGVAVEGADASLLRLLV